MNEHKITGLGLCVASYGHVWINWIPTRRYKQFTILQNVTHCQTHIILYLYILGLLNEHESIAHVSVRTHLYVCLDRVLVFCDGRIFGHHTIIQKVIPRAQTWGNIIPSPPPAAASLSFGSLHNIYFVCTPFKKTYLC